MNRTRLTVFIRSILSHLTGPDTRADVLSWYVTTSTCGAAIGAELGGRIVYTLEQKRYDLVNTYHAIFYLYCVTGTLNLVLSALLTKECELDIKVYSQVPQDESAEQVELRQDQTEPIANISLGERRRWYQLLTDRLSQISRPTRNIMYKLWILLALDSLADGKSHSSRKHTAMSKKVTDSSGLHDRPCTLCSNELLPVQHVSSGEVHSRRHQRGGQSSRRHFDHVRRSSGTEDRAYQHHG